jgi:hypothetical protein
LSGGSGIVIVRYITTQNVAGFANSTVYTIN